jgi:hypothetical protein
MYVMLNPEVQWGVFIEARQGNRRDAGFNCLQVASIIGRERQRQKDSGFEPRQTQMIFLVLAKHGGVSGPRVFHTKIHTTSKLTECDKGSLREVEKTSSLANGLSVSKSSGQGYSPITQEVTRSDFCDRRLKETNRESDRSKRGLRMHGPARVIEMLRLAQEHGLRRTWHVVL